MPAVIALQARQHIPSFAPVKSQWQNPNDILSILTLIGGDIVQCAVAQLAGSGPSFFTPVAFSFGWVAYSVSAVLAAIGDGRLMPKPDTPSILVHAESGHSRTNCSWVLGRLLRDHRPPGLHEKESGLTITLYHLSSSTPLGVPTRDWLYWSGLVTIIVQIGVSIIPGALRADWVVFVLTITGTLLALASAAHPQWCEEKWASRRTHKRQVVSLTGGNGSKDVIVLISNSKNIKLEDLAAARSVRSRYTITISSLLSVLWIAHLLTVAGLQSDAWYLLAVGALGMVQNVVVAGARRSPSAHGIHIENMCIIDEQKVFSTLVEAEKLERRVGLSLLPIFFPDGLRPEEEAWKQAKLVEYAKEDAVAHEKTSTEIAKIKI